MLGLLGDGLLRAISRGLNVFLFALALVGLVAALAPRRGIRLLGEGHLLVAPLILFAALFVRRTYNRSRVGEAVAASLPRGLGVQGDG